MNRIILQQASPTLRHIPTARVEGVATWQLEDLSRSTDDPARVLDSGDATKLAWTATLDAAAGPSQEDGRRLPVAATSTAAIGDAVLVVDPSGTRELHELGGLELDDYLATTTTLTRNYPAGSTVAGVGLVASIASPLTGDADEELALYDRKPVLRIVWTYETADGVLTVPESVQWQRHDPGDQHVGRSILWIAAAYPDLRARLPDDASLDRIVEAMAEEVANDLRARQVDPTRWLTYDRGRALVVARTLAHVGELGYAPGASDQEKWAAAATIRYQRRLDDLLEGRAGLAVTQTDPDDGAPNDTNTAQGSIFARM